MEALFKNPENKAVLVAFEGFSCERKKKAFKLLVDSLRESRFPFTTISLDVPAQLNDQIDYDLHAASRNEMMHNVFYEMSHSLKSTQKDTL